VNLDRCDVNFYSLKLRWGIIVSMMNRQSRVGKALAIIIYVYSL